MMMVQLQQIKNNRYHELLSVLDEVEGKAIIWCHWRHDIENVVAINAKAVKKDCMVLDPWLLIMVTLH